jgi:hypothetical protein
MAAMTHSSVRYQLREGSGLYARLGDETAPLRWISPARFGLRWRGEAIPKAGQKIPIELTGPEGRGHALLAEVEGFRIAGDNRELSLRLPSASLEEGQALGGLVDELFARNLVAPTDTRISQKEIIRDADQLRDLARSVARLRGRAYLRGENTATLIVAETFDADQGVLCWRLEGRPLRGPCTIELSGMASLYLLPIHNPHYQNGRLCMPLPEEVVRVRRRWQRRVSVGDGYTLRFAHPLWPKLTVERPLWEVSFGGASFPTSVRHDLLYPGLALNQVEAITPQGEVIRLRAEVRAVTPDGSGPRCRVQFWPESPRDAARWEVLVNRTLYPTTRVGCAWDNEAWSLYEISGYFSLSGKKPQDFIPVRGAYEDVSRKLDASPRLGFRAVRPSARGVEAAASCLKVYSGSWLGHQMAKRPGATAGVSPRRVLRDIYLRAYEPIQHDPGFRWFFGYIEASIPWMKTAHTDFALRYQPNGLAEVLPFRLWEASTDEVAVEAGAFTWHPADENDEMLLLESLQEKPFAYRDTLDFTPSNLSLRLIRNKWQGAGLARERHLFAIRDAKQTRAVVVLESADLGANLFHLLESMRVFPVSPLAPEEASPLYELAFAHARHWYKERGRENFVYMQEGGPDPTHCANLGAGNLWILSAELLPDWLEHIHRLTE